MRTLAYIPARSGSQAVRHKNIRPLAGIPLAGYTIRSAVRSGLFDEVLLSTDSRRYLKTLAPFGIRRDYLRPAELSGHDTPMRPGVMHALEWLKAEGVPDFDAVMILQPTTPFRTPRHMADALALLARLPEATCVVGVTRLHDHHPARAKKLREGVWLEDFCLPEPGRGLRQALKPDAYVRNGAIYLTRVSTLREEGSILGERAAGLEMPEANSINVDTPFDFLVAESALGFKDFAKDLAFFRRFAAGGAARRRGRP
ncbi:MAG: acylneuraminate cytidylyltransferase family protein [Elusimicrobia bacterium]|nr:acylneuraminate cytidylyltransferase family protein [Elusimicrobiota bacterium]